MERLRTIAFAVAACLATLASAQQEERQSTITNDDGTVTFRYWNDKAKNVQVDVQFAGRNPMTRDANGVWTATLGPAAPDMYPYCFIVDGVSVMDPLNPQYFPNEGFKNSLLEIKSKTGSLAHDIKDVPHGTVNYISYYSKSLGATNHAIVYLPPNYMMNYQKKYPVFYLISGTTDTEEVYYKVGRVNYILDNLLAEKAAKEMIVVLPYGNPAKLKFQGAPTTVPGASTKERSEEMARQMRNGGDVFSRDLINDLMPYIEKNYRTINNADHRAIGGFSRGGNQALFNGLSNLDKFAYLCSYSSFTSTEIPGVYDNAEETNKKIRLFWLGVGTDDFLYGNARDYMEFLDKKGIRSVKEFTSDKFGHTWMNAKYFLDKTLRLLFNKKASEAAMNEGQPAPAATGKEPQFTMGVIAMERDSDGVWSVKMTDYLFEPFKYCFVVDGMQVTDPSNMYISPDRGFKYSIADNPSSPFNFASMGDIDHGSVSYDVTRGEAFYMSPMGGKPRMPVMIQLVPAEGDTAESWFKIGGADAIADRLLADGKTKPCMITTSTMDFAQQGGGRPMMPGFKMNTLRADDYPTWSMRRRALVKLLIDLGKQPDPEMPDFGSFGGGNGGFGGGGF